MRKKSIVVVIMFIVLISLGFIAHKIDLIEIIRRLHGG